MLTVKVLPVFGRSVIATEDIKSGTWLDVADILVLNETDTKKVNDTALRDYTFTFSDTQDCLVMGLGEMFNHDDDANASYEIMIINGMPKMIYKARRTIKKGEQVFIDYTADLREGESKSEYLINLL